MQQDKHNEDTSRQHTNSSCIRVTLKSTSTEQERTALAVLCLEDAMAARAPFLHTMSPSKLSIYRWLHSRSYCIVFTLLFFAYIGSAFFEPSSSSSSNNIDINIFVVIVHILALLMLALDLLTNLYVSSSSITLTNVLHNAWLTFDAFMIGVGILDICIMILALPFPMIGRPFRAFVLMARSSSMRRMAGSLVRSIHSILDVLMSITFVMLIYAIAANAMYGTLTLDVVNPFESLGSSWIAMFQLLQNENLSDVTYGVLGKSASAYLFFGSFFAFVVLIFYSTCDAFIYIAYNTSLKAEVSASILRQWESLAYAFEYIDVDQDGLISEEEFGALLQAYDSSLVDTVISFYFDIAIADTRTEAGFGHDEHSMDLADFLRIGELLQLDSTLVGTRSCDKRTTMTDKQVTCKKSISSIIHLYWWLLTELNVKHYTATLYGIMTSRIYEIITTILIFGEIGFILLRSYNPDVMKTMEHYEIVLFAFIKISFIVEISLRLAHQGRQAFWASFWNRIDVVVISLNLLVTFVGVVVEFFALLDNDTDTERHSKMVMNFCIRMTRVLMLLRLLRVLRLRSFSTRLKTLSSAYFGSIKIGMRLMLITAPIIFFFASIGLELFQEGYGKSENTNADFTSFPRATLLVTRIAMDLEWSTILLHGLDQHLGWKFGVYFITCFVLAKFIVVSLLFQLIVEYFFVTNANPNEYVMIDVARKNSFLIDTIFVVKERSWEKDVLADDLSAMRALASKTLLEKYRDEFRNPNKLQSNYDDTHGKDLKTVARLVDDFGSVETMRFSLTPARVQSFCATSELPKSLHDGLARSESIRQKKSRLENSRVEHQ